jgi:hypothetical protein
MAYGKADEVVLDLFERPDLAGGITTASLIQCGPRHIHAAIMTNSACTRP